MIDRCEKNIYLEVDGGVTEENIIMPTKNGADVIVAGSAVFKSSDIPKTIRKMREMAK